MWAAHGNDLKGEKEVDFSVTEPTTKDLCSYLSDQLLLERIRKGTDNFDEDWLTAMTQEERVVANITAASHANKNKKDFQTFLPNSKLLRLLLAGIRLSVGGLMADIALCSRQGLQFIGTVTCRFGSLGQCRR